MEPDWAPDCDPSPPPPPPGDGLVEDPSSEISCLSDSSNVEAKPTLSPKAVSTERSTGYEALPVPCTYTGWT